MKKFLCLLALLSTVIPPLSAAAEEPIRFVAEVSDEALAEDAILLVHCLSSRGDRGWELSSEARGPYWLKVSEKGTKLEAVYRAGEAGEKAANFGLGESDAACEKLQPLLGASSLTPAPAPTPLSALAPPPLPAALAQIPPGELLSTAEEPRGGKTLLWVGAGVAAVVGGFLLVRAHSHRADFGSLRMN